MSGAQLEEELQRHHGRVQWSDLRAHSDRQCLFIVKAPLKVMDVALALAKDDKQAVQAWIEGDQLARPTVEQVKKWQTCQEKPFESAVIKPFVVAQPLEP